MGAYYTLLGNVSPLESRKVGSPEEGAEHLRLKGHIPETAVPEVTENLRAEFGDRGDFPIVYPADVSATTTEFSPPQGVTLLEAFQTIVRVWSLGHSHDPPEWVESESVALAEMIREHFSQDEHVCVVGRPEDWADRALAPEGMVIE